MGGQGGDLGECIAIAPSGDIYVTGRTNSPNFPITTGAYDSYYNGGSYDIFISKLNSELTSLMASTFLGGSADDEGKSLAICSPSDPTGIAFVYITGFTYSSDFPTTTGAYDTSYGGNAYNDVIVSKLNLELSNLIASTFLGESNREMGESIAIDTGDVTPIVTVTGYTSSSNFPTTSGAYDTSINTTPDVFISKLNSELTGLVASTFLGGSGEDKGESLVLDTSGNVYVTGVTTSTNFPTTSGAYDTYINSGWDDAFVSKLSSDLTSLEASTYLGAEGHDHGYSIKLDASGNVYVLGDTSGHFPTTPGAYDNSYNGGYADLFISKLNNALTGLLASTYLGGSGFYEDGTSLVIDTNGNVYVTGYTSSPDFPTTRGAYDTTYNGDITNGDAIISKLNSELNSLLASTYLGGVNSDSGRYIAINSNRRVFVTGYTGASDFPTTTSAYDTSFNSGAFDVFISKLNANLSLE